MYSPLAAVPQQNSGSSLGSTSGNAKQVGHNLNREQILIRRQIIVMTPNTIFRLASGGIACCLLLIALAGTAVWPEPAAGYQQVKHSGANEDWVQPTFHGLVVGKSTAADVIRVFGKPKWKGGVQEVNVP